MEIETRIATDITAQAEKPASLDAATRRFLEGFLLGRIAQIVATPKGQVVWMNASAREMFGQGDPRNLTVFNLVLNRICVVQTNGDSGAFPIPGSQGEMIFSRLQNGSAAKTVSVEEFLQIQTHGQDVIDACLTLDWVQIGKASYIKIAVEDLAHVDIDPLMGLCRRRKFDKDYGRGILDQRRHAAEPSWMETAPENRHHLAYLMIDVDHFKGVNDRHGHQAGDRVLSSVASRILKQCRTNDIVARYGGEEIVVLLPQATVEGALVVARRIHEAVRSKTISLGASAITVTVSIGVAFMEPGDTAETLSARADQAMYASKNNGRDRISWTPPAE